MIRIQNLSSTDKKSESSTWTPESTALNPGSKTVLDFLTWGESSVWVSSSWGIRLRVWWVGTEDFGAKQGEILANPP